MSYAPVLFSQLAELTAMRDIELMEFSLLKTINGLLLPSGLQLLKVDSKEQPISEIIFNNTECIVNAKNIKIPPGIQLVVNELLENINSSKSLKINNEYFYLYHLYQTRAFHVLLNISTTEPLSKLNQHLVVGMLQIYRNFCELLREGQTDLLTGLYNRKTFDDTINKIYSLIPKESEEFPNDKRNSSNSGNWIVMVDIDNFKLVNDRWGHIFGDEVLLLLAQTMMSSFRSDDMLFRFGGEEFVFVLSCDSQEGCRTTLEKFRTVVENKYFPQVGRVTVSLGACRMSRDIYPATIIDYADKAMYHSKKNGKNQLNFFEDLVESNLEKYESIQTGDIVLF